ncbi:MAG: hypothetical protein U9Q34_00225, partial [Elusimicrobiota bacterium]|nr:hypothetical protein [Elusimicrobiota bacterium]
EAGIGASVLIARFLPIPPHIKAAIEVTGFFVEGGIKYYKKDELTKKLAKFNIDLLNTQKRIEKEIVNEEIKKKELREDIESRRMQRK